MRCVEKGGEREEPLPQPSLSPEISEWPQEAARNQESAAPFLCEAVWQRSIGYIVAASRLWCSESYTPGTPLTKQIRE